MSSTWETPSDIKNVRIKWPYNKWEARFLQDLIFAGFKELKDINKWVNYEEICAYIISSIPRTIFAEEFAQYWEKWGGRFSESQEPTERDKIFEEMIYDLKNRWLIPSNTSGLTGNFSSIIEELLLKNPT